MKRLTAFVVSTVASMGLAVIAAAPAGAVTPPVPPLPELHVPCVAFGTATHAMETGVIASGQSQGFETASSVVDQLAFECYNS